MSTMVRTGFWRAVKREFRREASGGEASGELGVARSGGGEVGRSGALTPALSRGAREREDEMPSPARSRGRLAKAGRGRGVSLKVRVDCMAQGLLAGECFGGHAIVWRGLGGGGGGGGVGAGFGARI